MLKLNSERSLIKQLNEFRKAGTYCDVVLIIGNNRYSCHRNVLAAKSSYLRNKLVETRVDDFGVHELHLAEFDELSFYDLLCVMYENDITIEEIDTIRVISLYIGAKLLELNSVSDACLQHVLSNLNVSSALDICIHSCVDTFDEKLRNLAKACLVDNFHRILADIKFLDLPFDCLLDIVKGDVFTLREENVFETLSKWINYKLGERCIFSEQLALQCKYNLLNETYLKDFIDVDDILAKSIMYLKSLNCDSHHNMLYQPRKIKGIYIFGELLNERGGGNVSRDVVTCYNGDDFYRITKMIDGSMDRKKYYQRVSVCHGSFYKFSCNPKKRCNRFQRFDESQFTWVDLAVPDDSSVCVYNMVSTQDTKSIFFNTGSRFLHQKVGYNIYGYDIHTDQWFTIPTLPNFNGDLVNASSLVSYENVVYACGGLSCKNIPTDCLCQFDSRIGRWDMKCFMLLKLAYAAAVAYNNLIFVSGGIDNHYAMRTGVYKTMLVYDMRMNRWFTKKAMPQRRFAHNLVAFRDEIWAIGGPNCPTTCIFDIRRNSWKYGPSIEAATDCELSAVCI